ncbi:hypothetical protein ACROYT_G036770 [Oculina patagonica]
MRVSRVTVLVCIFLIVLVLVDLCDARGRGGGGRSGGSRSGGSRSSSKSRSRSRSGSSGSSKPKITKYTPIKPKTVRSPVIVSQTRQGSRSSMFKRVVVGYLVYRYGLSSAPVYRHGYPMYRSYVAIPKDRAVRLSYEEEKLLDAQGNLCLGKSSENKPLRQEIDDNLVELNTTIKYKNTGKTVKLHGIDNTVSLEDIKGQDFEVTSSARYDTTLVEGTNCTQIEKKVVGTMVEMYATNPDSASAVYINYNLLLASIALLGFIHVYKSTKESQLRAGNEVGASTKLHHLKETLFRGF